MQQEIHLLKVILLQKLHLQDQVEEPELAELKIFQIFLRRLQAIQTEHGQIIISTGLQLTQEQIKRLTEKQLHYELAT